MVRDPGWYLLDVGRGLERALQVAALLRSTLCTKRPAEVEGQVVQSVLTAAESIVTFRRRYRVYTAIESVLELLVFDAANPRAIAYQLERIANNLRAVTNANPSSRALRLVGDMREQLRRSDVSQLAQGDGESRAKLGDFLDWLTDHLRGLGEAITDQYFQQPPMPRPLWRSPVNSPVEGPVEVVA
jgi:uncharacterized alpha-E superfamily protein